MRAVIIYSLILVFLIGMSVSAFDGKRKGFTMGIGMGQAPVMTNRIEFKHKRNEYDRAGIAVHILLGYGFDERNVLVFHRMIASEVQEDESECSLTQGVLSSLTYYRYFRDVGKSAFLAVGIGNHYQNLKDLHNGTSLMLGFGHELTKLWQGGIYYVRGWTDSGGVSSRSQTIMCMITAVWR